MIAHQCPDYRVTVVDINPERIAAWNSDELPIYEPGLDEIVRPSGGKTSFSAPTSNRDPENDIIFVSVNTPTKTFGVAPAWPRTSSTGEDGPPQILQYAQTPKIVIEKSTLPVKTAQLWKAFSATPGTGSGSGPVESRVPGGGIRHPRSHEPGPGPHRIAGNEIGPASPPDPRRYYASWVPRERILTSNIWSSELSKLVSNAFLAQRISSINAISALCEKTEADVEEVARAVEWTAGSAPSSSTRASGSGDPAFKKDILNLVYLCRHYGLDDVAAYWESVVRINEYQQERFMGTMLTAMFNTLRKTDLPVRLRLQGQHGRYTGESRDLHRPEVDGGKGGGGHHGSAGPQERPGGPERHRRERPVRCRPL